MSRLTRLADEWPRETAPSGLENAALFLDRPPRVYASVADVAGLTLGVVGLFVALVAGHPALVLVAVDRKSVV